ncbi:MAG: hypothetical protein PUC65_14590 [Clostridiales bacterium]|nr:hypothetical protein [Clostridiales bacterium]
MNMNNKIDIDERKIRNMMFRIIKLEKDNIRTKEFTDNDIKNKIRQIIEEEIQCN